MKVALIVNSRAGRGRADREALELERLLRAGGVDVSSMQTDSRGGGIPLARAAGNEYDIVVAVGGDGTVNEVARGLFETNGRAELAVAPFGTGNDFAKVLGMPSNPAQVADVLLSSPTHRLDLGRVWTFGEDEETEAVFANAVGIGFDGLVAERAHSSRKVRGVAGYLYVALKTLFEWDYPDIDVEISGEILSNGPALLATGGNGVCSGGGFYLTPNADPSDGLVDLCVLRKPTALGIVRLVVGLLRGCHLGHPSVSYRQAESVAIRSSRGLYVHVDGETLANNARDVRIVVVPAALRIRAPRLG